MNDPLDHVRHREWALEGLVAAARELLATSGLEHRDSRVTSQPDVRSVRYYQQLGIVARPLRYDGRRAVYGYVHLLQLLAIKRLQAFGMNLAQVQRALAGRTAADLEGVLAGEAAGGLPRAPFPTVQPAAGASSPTSSVRALWTTDLAPGVTITLDPRLVRDPERLVARLTEALEAPDRGDP